MLGSPIIYFQRLTSRQMLAETWKSAFSMALRGYNLNASMTMTASSSGFPSLADPFLPGFSAFVSAWRLLNCKD
ncbi:hypothetical protein QQP08_026738 [Theobroma cacao]|uniref:Uncharacterized protein n=1 Tax=Theobroma cacao TaxID=3641 RepID=A0A061GX30_THECC|nr:Uncharacterized protein TCM_041618 [Theobroma cacao]WRX33434.1 hypothetical protein QQP08_025921 [Theobroma cacao]WRX34251.1 hypothetical protein QQP08_026738 [Theobroma cacao]